MRIYTRIVPVTLQKKKNKQNKIKDLFSKEIALRNCSIVPL